MIKTPGFWYQKEMSLAALLLLPLSWLYGLGVALGRNHPARVSRPVICVGNVTAGGAGKTPVVRSLADILHGQGLNPHILLRGYGGSIKGPVPVAANHTVADVGDEALLHAKTAPTWVSADRLSGAQAAIDLGAKSILMDDGFQNFSLQKDVSFLVIDGEAGLGNGLLMPAGPLRERFEDALARADGVVLIGADKTGVLGRLAGKPVFQGEIKGDHAQLAGQKVFAFAGIGRPEKFKKSLQDSGVSLSGFKGFVDHHPYSDRDMKELLRLAGNALLVTTEKDFVRLPPHFRDQVAAVPIAVVWQDQSALEAFLARRLAQ